MPAIDTIFATIADFSKTMGTLHGDFLGLVRRDIDRFLEITEKTCNQMQWQGWFFIGLSGLSASLAVTGALIPKGAGAGSNTLSDQRLNANDSIGDTVSNALKKIGEKLGDNKFLRSTCKTAAQFFGGITTPVNTLFDSQKTQFEAKRELMRVCFQEGQNEKNIFSQETRKAQESALNILQSKSKSN
jgi:predicted secreted protein